MAANAWKYGFIMSLPEGQDQLTCYMYEPWHYRYVGRTGRQGPRQQADAARVPVAPAGMARPDPDPDSHADPDPHAAARPTGLAPVERLAAAGR